MQRIIIVIMALMILSGCAPSNLLSDTNTLSRKEKNNGWQLLFDGKTSKGWHKYGGGAVDSIWKVKDGELCLDTLIKKQLGIKGDWDIVTDEEYENFDLRLEWKIAEKGNSGIIIYIHEDKIKFNSPWETGPEMQILDNGSPTVRGHPDAIYYTHRAGDLYDILASKEAVKSFGEWNQVKIVANKGKLDFYLNGKHILSTTMWDENWKKMIAKSKFKAHPGFGTYTKGRIGLQDHGDEVCFRNVKIRKL